MDFSYQEYGSSDAIRFIYHVYIKNHDIRSPVLDFISAPIDDDKKCKLKLSIAQRPHRHTFL